MSVYTSADTEVTRTATEAPTLAPRRRTPLRQRASPPRAPSSPPATTRLLPSTVPSGTRSGPRARWRSKATSSQRCCCATTCTRTSLRPRAYRPPSDRRARAQLSGLSGRGVLGSGDLQSAGLSLQPSRSCAQYPYVPVQDSRRCAQEGCRPRLPRRVLRVDQRRHRRGDLPVVLLQGRALGQTDSQSLQRLADPRLPGHRLHGVEVLPGDRRLRVHRALRCGDHLRGHEVSRLARSTTARRPTATSSSACSAPTSTTRTSTTTSSPPSRLATCASRALPARAARAVLPARARGAP